MAYNQYGSGHYDGVVWKNPDEDDGNAAEYPEHCNCGRGGSKGTPCNLQLNQYSTRLWGAVGVKTQLFHEDMILAGYLEKWMWALKFTK